MAKGDTKTNQYLDIAANGARADLPTDTCCETRSQTLIREVAERIMDVEDEVEEIKNNPDVVDIVATYADLQAYDTSHLTDKDIIRVLQDETHDGESTYYRYNKQSDTWTYVGTAGDYYTKTAADAKFQDKLTAGSNITISEQNVISATDTTYSDFTGTDGTAAGTAGLVPAPAATDADKFLKADGTWDTAGGGSSYTAGDGIDITNSVISATNTGKARVLTTADYNWPTSGTKTAVALWLLEPGVYVGPEDGTSVQVRPASGVNTGMGAGYPNMAIVLKSVSDSNQTGNVLFMEGDGSLTQYYRIQASGSGYTRRYLRTKDLANNLTTTTSDQALDARQGKVLKDLIDSIAIRGAGAPTTSTTGSVGTLYEDTTNGKLYICTDATNPYVWEEVGAGGGGSQITTLTAADFNYDYGTTGTNNSIAMWLLPDGIYQITASSGVPLYYRTAGLSFSTPIIFVIGGPQSSNTDALRAVYVYNENNKVQYGWIRADGSGATISNVLTEGYITQSTGTSTNSVMSQNAVTSMVFADPSGKTKVRVGNFANASGIYSSVLGYYATATNNYGVAIGCDTQTSHAGGVAIGSGATTSVAGEMNIGAGTTGRGYNSSNYRLLTGLYDPQSAHDAATKGYVDPTTDSSAPTTATVGRLGQIQIDTTNADAYMCVAVDDVTPSYTWKKINA